MRLNFLMVLALAIGLAWAAQAQTVDDIVAMVGKGESEEKLLAAVSSAKTPFDLSASQVLLLRAAKTPDNVILAMLQHNAAGTAEGALTLENLDDKTWSYIYEPELKTLWISSARANGKGNIAPQNSVKLRMAPGDYRIRYNRRDTSVPVSVVAGQKSSVMLSRVTTNGVEALYVTIFESGERKTSSRLTVLGDGRSSSSPPAAKSSAAERDAGVQAPSNTTIVYQNYVPPPVVYAPPQVVYAPPPVVYAPPPVVYSAPPPVYYAPWFRPFVDIGIGFGGRIGHHGRWSVGVGF